MSRSNDGLALDDQLCFALYAASRAMTARYRPHLDAMGITYPQFLVMIVLWDEGPASVNGIGERLHLDSGTLSPLLKRLEANGLISRTRSEADERSVIVAPTAKGRRLRPRAAAMTQELRCVVEGTDIEGLIAELRALDTMLRDNTGPRPV